MPSARGTWCSRSHWTPGRIAAAIVKPRNRRATRTFSFQSASASATSPITISVATAVRRAVSPMLQVFLAKRRKAETRVRCAAGGGPPRQPPPRHRARPPVRLRGGVHGARPHRRRGGLAGIAYRAAACHARGAPRAAGGLALGADEDRRHDGEALHRARDAPAAGRGGAAL